MTKEELLGIFEEIEEMPRDRLYMDIETMEAVGIPVCRPCGDMHGRGECMHYLVYKVMES